MTTPFWCVLIAIFLPYVFSGIAVYHRQKQFGSVDNTRPREQSAQLTGAGARAYAAQQNAWEALPVFGLSVLVAHAAGADPGSSATASMLWVAARVAHGIFYVSDLATFRSLSFGVGIGCCVWLFWLAAAAA
jgi:uncharacterized MAPEG superfamily protein